ncbi:MAG TPA: Lrp/AsnC ligand binding domain-containing protein [Thermoanaerobaculia bacterium]|nr:Lrp/AsnC ligand binding domain-containing protein [Thermoanaerobaculia bacterium]
MITAFVLLSVAAESVNEVADALAAFEGVAEVHSVAGQWDLVAVIRARSNEELADLVTEKVRAVPGVRRSETLIGFKVVSRHDLERMFSIGME